MECTGTVTASRALIPHPCSRFRWGMHAMWVVPGQGMRGATCGVGMGYAKYPRPTLPGYSDHTEWGMCCTQVMNGHLHGSCTTCTLPCTQFGYATYLAAGLRLHMRVCTTPTQSVYVCCWTWCFSRMCTRPPWAGGWHGPLCVGFFGHYTLVSYAQ